VTPNGAMGKYVKGWARPESSLIQREEGNARRRYYERGRQSVVGSVYEVEFYMLSNILSTSQGTT